MGKLFTTLKNNTDKELVVYKQSSNGSQRRVALLHPLPVTITTSTTNYVSEKSRSTQEGPNCYVLSVDPNDSYSTIRIWQGMEAVLGVSTDEMIDNSTITIEFKDGVFIKECEQRGARIPASTSEGDASNKKDLWGDFRNIFRNIFRLHKSANSNAGK